MMIITNDGALYCADDAAALVRDMAETQRFGAQGTLDYMADVSRRIFDAYGHAIADDDCEAFIDDLTTHGFVAPYKPH